MKVLVNTDKKIKAKDLTFLNKRTDEEERSLLKMLFSS